MHWEKTEQRKAASTENGLSGKQQGEAGWGDPGAGMCSVPAESQAQFPSKVHSKEHGLPVKYFFFRDFVTLPPLSSYFSLAFLSPQQPRSSSLILQEAFLCHLNWPSRGSPAGSQVFSGRLRGFYLQAPFNPHNPPIHIHTHTYRPRTPHTYAGTLTYRQSQAADLTSWSLSILLQGTLGFCPVGEKGKKSEEIVKLAHQFSLQALGRKIHSFTPLLGFRLNESVT